MKPLPAILLLLCLRLAAADTSEAPGTDGAGEVRVPLPAYTRLLRQSETRPPEAPAAYAVGQARITVDIVEHQERTSAQVSAELPVEVFQDRWTLVPLLPPGVALSAASADGLPVNLVRDDDGLAWSSRRAGTVTLRLAYEVAAGRSEHGFTLALPVPKTAAELLINYPGTGLDFAVVPAAGQRVVEDREAGVTRISASVPAAESVLLTWRAAGQHGHVISRASYRGELSGDAVLWRARYQVELFSAGETSLALLPATLNLIEFSVDGREAVVLVREQRFSTLLKGRGRHEIEAVFQTPVRRGDGPPRVDLAIPPVPISRFELSLPGDKEVRVMPPANVASRGAETGDGPAGLTATTATVFMPLTERLSFSWLDAVPEELQTQTRANASLYHALYAEEGVLHGHAMIDYRIARGETKLLELALPAGVQVNRVVGDGVADWTAAAGDGGDGSLLKVFLNRPLQGDYLLEVFYERLLGLSAENPVPGEPAAGEPAAGEPAAANVPPVAAPLLLAENVQRQRGMVALLAGQELTLQPVASERLSAVGENQLPVWVRERLALSVAHTYKYTEAPLLRVNAVAPQRQQGKFNARVDTLISVGEVTLRGSASIEINVKSGVLRNLELRLPNGVNLLGVTAAGLSSQQLSGGDQGQTVTLEFNREMEGQFRVEVNYERIMTAGVAEAEVPLVTVAGADVAHGQIAVEALTAVEVRAGQLDRLSLLEAAELPRQLLLKTTNPILLAYKYVTTEPPRLQLQLVRHREIEVQQAAIETARYRTLVTAAGLAVTTARYQVRNSRRQFLRLALPADSQVWSLAVDGQAEKPARAGGGENDNDDNAVLIKLINSAAGFPVDIVYATPAAALDTYGTLSGQLPDPDMIVTDSVWDVYLPIGYRYLRPTGNLEVAIQGRAGNPRREAGAGDRLAAPVGPPHIEVPSRGVHFRFTRLYANQGEAPSGFSMRYLNRQLSGAALTISVLGAALVWLGIFALWGERRLPRAVIAGCFGFGLGLLLLSIGSLQVSPVPAAALSLAVVVLWALARLLRLLRRWRAGRGGGALGAA